MALLARMANWLLLPEGPAAYSFPDSPDYLNGAALWLRDGDLIAWFYGEQLLPSERMPGYFWFLSGLMALGLETPRALALAQAPLDALTCGLVFLLGRLHSTRVGLLAGGFAALSPTLIVHSTLILQDTLFLLPFTGALLCATLAVLKRDWRWAAAAGALLGAATIVRAVTQYFILIAPIAIAIGFVLRRADLRKTALAGGAALLGAALVLSPIVWRSIAQFGTPYPTTQTGLHALYWFVPLIRMTGTGRTFDQESRINAAEINALLAERGIDIGPMDPYQRDGVFRALAREKLLALPPARIVQAWAQGAPLTLFAPATLSDGRVRAMERPSFYETPGGSLLVRARGYLFEPFGHFQQIIVSSALLSGLSLLALAIGGVALLRRAPLAAIGATMVMGYFLAVSGPTSGPKYRMPMQAVLILIAAVGVDAAAREAGRFAKHRQRADED